MNITLALMQGNDLGTRLETGFESVAPMISTNYETPLQLVRARLVDVLVVDDRIGPVSAFLHVIDTAIQTGIKVFALLTGPARHTEQRLRDQGVWITEQTSTEDLGTWIAQTLGLSRRQCGEAIVIATASAKGGASKTTLACLLAEALAYRGEKVLIWEADLSNAAIRQHYGFGIDARPYTELADPHDRRGWNTASVSSYIVKRTIRIRNQTIELDFLLGPSNAASLQDLERHQWNALHDVIKQLPFTIVIVDTGPEILRRPTAFHVLDAGGFVVVPCPTGVLEREGAANLLSTIREWDSEALKRCGLVFVEPERDAISLRYLPAIRQTAQQNFKSVQHLGLLPRDARAISSAAQILIERGMYISPLEIAPHSKISQATWQLTEALSTLINRPFNKPIPHSSWINRLFKQRNINHIQVFETHQAHREALI